ncbi:hypothetical protein [Cellulosimicrobium cellulans]|uniref:YtxH domain-containing protein n=1 Tax=Cellulosimicrobium cellulans TaxID=1710 RepID=A0A4Y4E3W9_CELCE|nr:hypothetical protein [Cellulosimicrobium cellulans]GED11667.1 hypothetical protein CCE02nite_36660 [Cellulosimicrobium cellulans]
MIGGKTFGHVVFFGLGYLAGTRAGRERYAQIEAGARALVARLRERLEETDGGAPSASRSRARASEPDDDITLGG